MNSERESEMDLAGEALTKFLVERVISLEQQVENLEGAMTNARRIGVAIGVIMALEKITQDKAFLRLSKASQLQNRKLHLVAADVIDAGWV